MATSAIGLNQYQTVIALNQVLISLLKSLDQSLPFPNLFSGPESSDDLSPNSTDEYMTYLEEIQQLPPLGEVHLDVLDPRFVPSSSTPSADGLTIDELATTMSTVLATGKVAALTITSLNPGAGARGQRSIASALTLLKESIPAWTADPASPAS